MPGLVTPRHFLVLSSVLLMKQNPGPAPPCSGSRSPSGPTLWALCILCARAHTHTQSLFLPRLPLAGVGGHYTFLLHCKRVVASGQSWAFGCPVICFSYPGWRVTAGTERPCEESSPTALSIPALAALSGQGVFSLRKGNTLAMVRGGNRYFQTLETVALI